MMWIVSWFLAGLLAATILFFIFIYNDGESWMTFTVDDIIALLITISFGFLSLGGIMWLGCVMCISEMISNGKRVDLFHFKD